MTALAWDVSAIPEGGLTELEVFRPAKKELSHPPPPPGPRSVPKQTDPEPPKQSSREADCHSVDPQVIQEKSKLQPGCPFNLSTITEESGSYKSSSSGSRLTVSSASSKYVQQTKLGGGALCIIFVIEEKR